MDYLKALCARIRPPKSALYATAAQHLDNLTKPQGSLGYIERIAARLFAIQGGCVPLDIDPARLFTVAGDHGVAAQGVSPFPQAVTRQMVHNFLAGGAAVNVLCRSTGMDLTIVDAGCVGGAFAAHQELVDARQGEGTADFTLGPAMSVATCRDALLAGADLVGTVAAQGCRCVGAGEMGIANTSAATALMCRLLHIGPQVLAGPGAGASPKMLRHKIAVIDTALSKNPTDTSLAALAALGGFEIALMAGIMLGGAAHSLPVLVDGFISTSAFVAACALCPSVAQYAFIAHSSAEKGQGIALAALAQRLPQSAPEPYPDMRPLLQLDMRLGEGTGVALALPLLRAAAAVYNNMATFAQANVTGEPCTN